MTPAERQAWRDRAPIRARIARLEQEHRRAVELADRGDADPAEAAHIAIQIAELRVAS